MHQCLQYSLHRGAQLPAVLLALTCSTAGSDFAPTLAQLCTTAASNACAKACKEHAPLLPVLPALHLAPPLLAAPLAVPPRQVPTLPEDDGIGVGLSGHEGQAGQPAALVPQHQRHGWALLRAGRDVGERGDNVGTPWGQQGWGHGSSAHASAAPGFAFLHL